MITYHRDITGALWYVPHCGKASNITITWILWSVSKKETSTVSLTQVMLILAFTGKLRCALNSSLLGFVVWLFFGMCEKQKQKLHFALERSLTTDHRIRK